MLPRFQSFLFCVGKSLWGAKMAKNPWPKREKSRLTISVKMLEHNSIQPFFAGPLDDYGLHSGGLLLAVKSEALDKLAC